MTHGAACASWQRAWAELGATADASLRDRLLAAWSEPHRHYHTLQHLRECLGHFDAARAIARRPAEVSLALWFHDAIYDPRRHDNEQRSADWARASLLQAGAAPDAAERVHALVLATRHESVPHDPDEHLVVDIDLAILGAPRARFDEYERQVALEYAHVPPPQRRAGRTRILRAFLARPAIYGTPYLRDRFEARARVNLEHSLAKLG